MNIDVAKAIKELLFENDSVILPGLGGFTSSPVSATVDYVQGAVQPPTKKMEFNTNLVINDGVLVNYLQKSNLVTAQEASTAIENYVAGIMEALEAREIVEIPEVGRLYKDYEQKTRFMPDNTNFHVDAFGLPTVKFNPVARPKKVAEKKQAGDAKSPPPVIPSPQVHVNKKATDGDAHWAEKMMPLLIVVAAVLLAFSLFVWLKGCGGSQPQANVPQERLNVKPKPEPKEDSSEPTDTETATLNGQTDEPNKSPQATEENQSGDPETNNGSPATTPSTSQIFIVIHSFGNRNNAQKFARNLEKAGYTATTKKHGGLYRVGVEMPSHRRSEVGDLINELGRKFNSKPVEVDY